jgi:2,3-bisphosphoglycerate-dependent phosphoglycerate mutase
LVPTRVLLLRHAETADPSVFHGAESDVGLSERGRRQAERLALLLAEASPAAVVSSAMRRAVDTAAPIAAACGLPLRVEPDLHERRVGALSGTPTQGKEGVWPDTLRRWVAGETGHAPPGAESFDAIRDRVVPVWRRLTQDYEGQTLVIVAHGIVCRVVLLTELPGLGPADWHRLGPIRNLGVNELVWTSTAWEAVRLNEVPASLGE